MLERALLLGDTSQILSVKSKGGRFTRVGEPTLKGFCQHSPDTNTAMVLIHTVRIHDAELMPCKNDASADAWAIIAGSTATTRRVVAWIELQ
jgi:hypothetical protein